MSNKIGVICDMHLNGSTISPQYMFLKRALEMMKEDAVDTVVCLGDVTAHGEIAGRQVFDELIEPWECYEVIGNSDVRDAHTAKQLANHIKHDEFTTGNRHFLGIHTPYGIITSDDRKRLDAIKPGDVVFLHHDIDSLEEDSRTFLMQLIRNVPVLVLHGHLHKFVDYMVGDSRVIGVKCLDPDKCISSVPCVTYLEFSDDDVHVQERRIGIPENAMRAVSRYFGISCVDNQVDVAYALEHDIKHVELRCIDDWKPDWTLLPLVEKWKAQTKGYLSVHMPDIRIKDGVVVGKEQWNQALQYALALNADGLTIHTPRVKQPDMPRGSEKWNEILSIHVDAVKRVAPNVKIGIENLHVNKGEKVDENRGFGYTPEEVTLWIDSINAAIGIANRVGHVLDVGHARNNSTLAEIYPVSRWYEIMGNKTVAYHIHQVVPENGNYKNHCALENWFGPMINYTSFFWSWQAGLLNHVPVFLEVKGHKNFEKSMRAFNDLLMECELQ